MNKNITSLVKSATFRPFSTSNLNGVQSLLTTAKMGDLTLKNRVVMCALTR